MNKPDVVYHSDSHALSVFSCLRPGGKIVCLQLFYTTKQLCRREGGATKTRLMTGVVSVLSGDVSGMMPPNSDCTSQVTHPGHSHMFSVPGRADNCTGRTGLIQSAFFRRQLIFSAPATSITNAVPINTAGVPHLPATSPPNSGPVT